MPLKEQTKPNEMSKINLELKKFRAKIHKQTLMQVVIFCFFRPTHILQLILKGHWTSVTSSPTFSKKSWDFYNIRNVGLGNDCMQSFTI